MIRSCMTEPHQTTSLQEGLQHAHAALSAGRAGTAERRLRLLVATYPKDPSCLWLLGAALLYQDQIAESIEVLERALEHAPDLRMRAWILPGHAAVRSSRPGPETRSALFCKCFRIITAHGSPTVMYLLTCSSSMTLESPSSGPG